MKILVSRMIDVIEEYAFRYKTYGKEVLVALQSIKDFWTSDFDADASGPYGAFGASILRNMGNQVQSDSGMNAININFFLALEEGLTKLTKIYQNVIVPIDLLKRVIEHYKAITNPKAFALLASLAKQSDLDYSKRKKEHVIKKLADAAASGVQLPAIFDDIKEFSSGRFENLEAQIPKGQSILDFYILNQIKHRLSKHALGIVETVRLNGIPRNVFFGSLEQSTPGAQIIPVEGADEYLVILSRALWTASSLASGIIAKCIMLEKFFPAPIGFKKNDSDDLKSSLELFDRVLSCEKVDFEYPLITDNSHKLFHEFLDCAMKTFF